MLTNCKVLFIQFSHLAYHIFHKFFSELDEIWNLIIQVLQFICNLAFQVENRTLQSNHVGCWFTLIKAEKLKVTAEIKNIEFFFILAVNKQWTQTCTTAYHLPEFRLAHNFFKKHKVKHFRHVDTCIHHINGYCNLRQFFRVGKFINSTLCIGHIVINDLCISRQMRIFLAKHFKDFFGMLMIFCKNDSFAKFLTIIYFQTFSHQYV